MTSTVKPRISLSAAQVNMPWICPPANRWVCRCRTRVAYGPTPQKAYAAWSRS